MTTPLRDPYSPPEQECEAFASGRCVHTQHFLQQERLQSLGLMVGEVAHDLNNVFSMMLGQVELLEEDFHHKSLPIPEHMLTLLQSLKRGSGLCQSMLACAGKVPASTMACDPVKCINEIQQLLRVSISPMASFTCELVQPLPFIKADAGQVQQIVMNLLMNASDALEGEPGHIRLRVIPHTLAPNTDSENLVPGQYGSITVSDNGCGMDDQTQAKLFNPFFTTKLTGKGLGLTSVSHLVHALHGSLQVASTLGEGSTFTVLLPATDKQPDASAPANIPFHQVPNNNLSLSGTVLLVDDEEHMCKVGAEILGRTGANVITATSGKEAIECFRAYAEEIDLVLLDVIMPDINGCDVYKTIHDMKPDSHVVLISGHTGPDLEYLLGDMQPSDILLKPVPMHKFQQTAARFLPPQKDSCS